MSWADGNIGRTVNQQQLSRPERLTVLSARHWSYLAAILFLVLPLVLSIVFEREIYRWYLRREVVPKLEAQLGFSSGAIPVRGDWAQTGSEMFGIVRVVPSGAFAASGFQAGDIPVGNVDGFLEGFVSDIRSAVRDKRTVEIGVINCTGREQLASCPRRTVLFKPPR
jgi:hypothetical protein